MDENNSIQLFEDRKIRTAWDEEQEEWYFSVVDVIAVLTDSSNPTDRSNGRCKSSDVKGDRLRAGDRNGQDDQCLAVLPNTDCNFDVLQSEYVGANQSLYNGK